MAIPVLPLTAGWPFALGAIVLRNFLAVIGKTKIPLILVLLTVVINAGLNALLIFGLYGLPKLGLVGAGLGSGHKLLAKTLKVPVLDTGSIHYSHIHFGQHRMGHGSSPRTGVWKPLVL